MFIDASITFRGKLKGENNMLIKQLNFIQYYMHANQILVYLFVDLFSVFQPSLDFGWNCQVGQCTTIHTSVPIFSKVNFLQTIITNTNIAKTLRRHDY